jgi:hypothetical protein
MYALLRRVFPAWLANLLMVLWYALLIILVCRWFLFSEADFRYRRI